MTKKALYVACALSVCAAASGAATLTLDDVVASADLHPSNPATEHSFVANALGVDESQVSYVIKYEGDTGANALVVQTDDAGQYFVDVGQNASDYFILKFGNGGTSGLESHYLLHNVGELDMFVWTDDLDDQWQGSGDLMGRLSHVTLFAYDIQDDIPHAPLPASGLLLLAGLGGVVASRRRKAS